MQLLVEKNTKLVKFIFSDDEIVCLNENNITVGVDADNVIICHNKDDIILYDHIEIPSDGIVSNQYFYDGTIFEKNLDYILFIESILQMDHSTDYRDPISERDRIRSTALNRKK